jgi:RNA polymerase sigma-70 factor (ECF subfamily)
VHPTDHELVRLTAEGDSEAFTVLVRRWEVRVAQVLTPLVVRREDVEDLRQEVFVRVLTASGRYRSSGEFSTWLYRIVLNLARDHARRRKLPVQLLEDEPCGVRELLPPQEASHRELTEAVADSLAALPMELRELLVLKHYGELSFTEMSQVLQTSASTLKSRMAIAHGRLRSELAARGVRDAEVEK